MRAHAVAIAITLSPVVLLSCRAEPPADLPRAELDLSAVVGTIDASFRHLEGELRARSVAHTASVRRDTLSFLPHRAAAPLRVRTSSLQRGGVEVADGSPSFALDGGALTLARGPAVERLENREDGVEQSWRFAGAIPGSGDLVVRVVVDDYELAAVTPSGLHFRESAGSAYVRYGHATWIDGERRTHVPAVHEGGAIVLRVPAALLDASQYPAILDPIISAESGIDQPIQWPSLTGSSPPRTASGAGFYLVVWNDGSLMASRVRESDGAIMDPAGIVLVASGADEYAVEFDGMGSFVVVHSTLPAGGIFAQRLSAGDGALLDPIPVAISESQPGTYRTQPAIARGAGGMLATWRWSDNGAGEIHGRRINLDLSSIDQNDTNATSSPENDRDPAVGFVNGHYVVAWETSGTTSDVDFAARRWRESDGALLDPAGINPSLPGPQRNPMIASDGTSVLIAWEDGRNSRDDVYGRRVDVSTGTYDTPETLLRLGGSLFDARRGLEHHSSGYLLTWAQPGSAATNVFGRRITDALVPLDGALDTGILLGELAPDEASPQVAAGANGFFVAWQRGSQVAGRRVDIGLAFLDPTPLVLSTRSTLQVEPAVANAGGIFLVTWLDQRVPTEPNRRDVFAARVRQSDGAILDPAGIELYQNVGLNNSPSVASDGTDFLVVWPTFPSGGLLGTRIDGTTGAIVDEPRLAISAPNQGARRPSVGYESGRYLVSWDADQAIYAARIDAATGAILDVPPLRPGSLGMQPFFNQSRSAVSCAGGNCVVAWRANLVMDNRNIFAGRIDMTTGMELDPQIRVLSFVTGGEDLAAATDGLHYLMAWRAPDPNGQARVFGRRMRVTDGVLVDSSTIAISSARPMLIFEDGAPSLCYDGIDFLAAWTDRRNIETNGHVDVYAARIDPSGTVLDVDNFALTTTTTPSLLNVEPNPGLASGGGGISLAVYPRFDPSPPFRNVRIRARFIENFIDAGSADAGADAGDADEPDADEADAGEPDADELDADDTDAAETDAQADAAELDAEVVDAVSPDANVADAAEADTGVDAGREDTGFADSGTKEEEEEEGCGCNAANERSSWFSLWLLLVAAATRLCTSASPRGGGGASPSRRSCRRRRSPSGRCGTPDP